VAKGDILVNIDIRVRDGGVDKQSKAIAKEVEKLNKKFEGTARATKKASKELKGMDKITDDLKTRIFGSSMAFTELNQSLELLERGFRALNATMVASVNQFVEFERALVGVGKTTNILGPGLEKFGDRIQELGKETPIAVTSLLDYAQTAGQLGVRGTENLLKFSDTISKLTVTTNLMGEEAASSLTRILTITKEGVENIDTFSSVVVALGNNFAATEEEIVRATNEVARATAVFGVGSADAAGLATSLKQLGLRAELAGTSIGRTFRVLERAVIEGGTNLQKLAQVTGMTSEEVEKAFGDRPVELFRRFLKGLQDIDEAGGSIAIALEQFGLMGDEINKVLPVLSKNTDVLNKALQISAAETENATALNEEAARVFATLSADIGRLTNAFKFLGTELGATFSPLIKASIKVLTFFINTLAEAVQVVSTFKREISAISFVAITVGLTKLIKVLAASTVMTKALGVALRAVIAPFVVLSVKIVAIGAALYAFVEGISEAANEIMRLPSFQREVSEEFDVMGEAISEIGRIAKSVFTKFIELIKLLAITVTGTWSTFRLFLEVGEELKQRIIGNNEAVEKSIERQKMLRKQMSELKKLAGDTWGSIIGNVEKANDKIDKTVQKMGTLMEAFKEFGPITKRDFFAETFRSLDPAAIGDIRKGVLGDTLEKAKLALDIARQAETKALSAEGTSLEREQKILEAQAIRIRREAEFQSIVLQQSEALTGIVNDRKESEFEAFKEQVNLINLRKQIALEAFDKEFAALKKLAPAQKKLIEEARKGLEAGFSDEIAQVLEEERLARMREAAEAEAFAKEQAIALVNSIVGGIGTGIEFAAEAMSMLFSPKMISGLSDTFDSIANLPRELLTAFTSLVNNLDRFVLKFSDAVVNVLNRMPEFIAKIFDALPQIIDAIFDAFGEVFARLPFFAQQILAELPAIISQILDRLPEFIQGFVQAAGLIVAELLRMLPSFISELAEGMPEIVESLVESLTASAGDIISSLINNLILGGGLERIVGALIRAVPRIALALVTGFVKGLQRALDSILFGKTIPNPFKDLPRQADEALKSIGQRLTEESGKLFAVKDIGIGREAEDFKNTMNDFLINFDISWRGFLDGLVQAWHNILRLFDIAWMALMEWFQNLPELILGAWRAVIDFIERIPEIIQTAWAGVIMFFEGLGDVVMLAWEGVFGFFNEFGKKLFDLFSPLKNLAENLKNIFEKNPLTKALGRAGDFLKKIHSSIKSILSAIRDLPGKIADAIGGGVSGATEGAKGFVEKTTGIRLAKGGMVPLYAANGAFVPRGTDTVPAMLTPGEFVINRDAVSKLGLNTMAALNRGQAPGGNTIVNQSLDIRIDSRGQQIDESFVRQNLVPTIKKELKRSSQNGEFIISRKGLRD
jgi:TP901 family phage tail tape measure protein